MVAVVVNAVVARIDIHVLVDDEFLARIGLIGVHFHGPCTGLREPDDAHDVALTLYVYVVAISYFAEGLQGFRRVGFVPHTPERVVLGAEAPESEGLQAKLAGPAHLVEQGHAVEEPDYVALI